MYSISIQLLGFNAKKITFWPKIRYNVQNIDIPLKLDDLMCIFKTKI